MLLTSYPRKCPHTHTRRLDLERLRGTRREAHRPQRTAHSPHAPGLRARVLSIPKNVIHKRRGDSGPTTRLRRYFWFTKSAVVHRQQPPRPRARQVHVCHPHQGHPRQGDSPLDCSHRHPVRHHPTARVPRLRSRRGHQADVQGRRGRPDLADLCPRTAISPTLSLTLRRPRSPCCT